ncbi:protein FAM177A1 isoform X1 [Coregonus clupeaformis]|uniref:protein FAM177A1 isoform X1 n=1 Tax=Coregonus clupeaformis TaxID=59861 RepID=UPI001E1C69BF|nr:protein FAM177A1 isoform X1 [Coregonus clupeaformis]
MAEISLYLTNVNVSLGQTMDVEKSPSSGKDFESVQLGDLEKGEQKEQKAPRRIIHFSSGETMEEYSTDEEEEEGEDKEPEKDLLSPPVNAVRTKLTWGPYFWFHMWRAATSTVSACDYLGERMASLFGITSAKYQYAIDEYYRMRKEKEEEDEDNRLSEEAEQYFDENQDEEIHGPMTDQLEGTTTIPHTTVTYQVEKEPKATPTPTAIRVPAIVTTTT